MEGILKNDLKKAAYHEAGHLIIIRHFGGEGQIVLKPTFTDNIKDEKGFIGHAHYTGIGDNLNHMALIGCAGFIAEIISSDSDIDMDTALELWDLEYDDLSETDKKFTFNIPDDLFSDAFALVKQLWSKIEAEASRNIEKYTQEYKQYLNQPVFY